jgi:histidine triad (HIT) family protein
METLYVVDVTGGGQAKIPSVPECLFCRIVSGGVPASRVLESPGTLSFRDISPQAPTHVLVIPKDHYPDLAALAAADGRLLAELLSQAAEVARAEGISGSGYRVVFNTGDDAGQAVPHVHAHVLGGRALGWPPG